MRLFILLVMTLLVATAASADPFKSPENMGSAEGYTVEVLAKGLSRPWSMVWLPDGAMLITERTGHVRLFREGVLQSKTIPGAPAVLSLGQGGLLDISLHPDFKTNRLVYFTLATGTRQSNRTTLARARYDGMRLSGVEEIFKVSQAKTGGQHFGSRMLWLPDGTLLMSIGDGGNPPSHVDGVLSRTLAQSTKSHLGKVLQLTDDGTPVASGPFASAGGLNELYTIGHRNIQGLAFDPIRDNVWASEHGALGGDELNLLKVGGNYGWPKATFSKEYWGARDISDHTSLPGMVDPSLVWMEGIAPSGLAVYTADKFPTWRGNVFAGGLKDQSVRRIILDRAGSIVGEQIIEIGQRVRDVRQGPDGYLYILTDESNGQLLRLVPAK